MKHFLFLLLLLTSSCTSFPKRSGIIIAHRGASAFLPEHTLEAYSYAYASGVDFVEPDVVLTKDNIPICLHDIYLEKTTNVEERFPTRSRKDGHWYAIDFTLKEIKQLQVHERSINNKPVFPKRFSYMKSSFKVPTLSEFIELIQGLNSSTGKTIGIYPEIKKPEFHLKNGRDSAKIILAIIKKYGYENHKDEIFIQSFDPKTLRELKTNINLIQLIGENSWGDSSTDNDYLKTNKGLQDISQYAKGIGIWFGHIKNDPSLIKRAKRLGLKVHAYTHRPESSSKNRIDYFTKMSLDGVFTDTPNL